jgi:hypothetical protein
VEYFIMEVVLVERVTDRAPKHFHLPGHLVACGPAVLWRKELGKRFGTQESEDRMEKQVKGFLRKCWSACAHVTAAFNEIYGKS